MQGWLVIVVNTDARPPLIKATVTDQNVQIFYKRCSIRNVNYIKENLKDKTTQVYFQYQRLEWTLKTNFARHRNIKINGLKGWYENSASTHIFHITWRYYEREISRSLVDVGSYKSLICIYKMGKIGGKPPRERLFGIIELKLSPLRII